MTDNVVSFRPGDEPLSVALSAVQTDIVGALECLLEQARAGQLQELIFATFDTRRYARTGWCSINRFDLLALGALLQSRIGYSVNSKMAEED